MTEKIEPKLTTAPEKRAGTISPDDLSLFHVLDSAREAAEFIRNAAIGKFGLAYGVRPHRRWFLFE